MESWIALIPLISGILVVIMRVYAQVIAARRARAVKIHSDVLKGEIEVEISDPAELPREKKWSILFPPPPRPSFEGLQELSGYRFLNKEEFDSKHGPALAQEARMHEERIEDLLKNHLPPSKHWISEKAKAYQRDLGAYRERLKGCFDGFKRDLSNSGILGTLDREQCYLGGEDRTATLFDWLCDFAGEILRREREGQKVSPDSLIEVVEKPDGKAYLRVKDGPRITPDIPREIAERLKEVFAQHVGGVRNLLIKRDELEGRWRGIRGGLAELLSYPVLPGGCQFIREAAPLPHERLLSQMRAVSRLAGEVHTARQVSHCVTTY